MWLRTHLFLIQLLLETRAEIGKKNVGFLEELKTRKKSSEIFWPLGYIFMKMTYSMRQQHALIKMNAIFKFACHKDVAQPKSLL